MPATVTQTEAVIALLRSRGEEGLTPIEALNLIGSFRLGARIYDAKELIGDDEEIVTERVTRYGKNYARYVLRKKAVPGQRQETIW